MYDLSNVSTQRKSSPYLSYGDNQLLRINKIELPISRNTGSPKAVLHMEGQPIEDPEFVSIEGAKGRVGKIGCGVYMKTEAQKEEFFKKMKLIAQALGLENDFNEIKGDTLEEVVSKINDVICGENKWAKYTVLGEQYSKNDGSVGLRLMFPRWQFVESRSVPEDQSRIVKFDQNNPNHLKKIVKSEGSTRSEEPIDFPF